MNNYLITNKSPIIGTPDKLKLELRKHQKAMFYKCLMIEKNILEKNEKFGIMADKAGAGKTAVIISLILADKMMNGNTQNLIIVPQNIYTQWIEEINKFAGDTLTVKSFVEYSDISELYTSPNIIMEYDILISTSLYYETIFTTIQECNFNIKRVILDEFDTMTHVFDKITEKEQSKTDYLKKNQKNKHIPVLDVNTNKIIWLVSASIDNAITEEGLMFQNRLIKPEEINRILCKCDEKFIDESNFKLVEPEFTTVTINDISDDYFNFLSIEQLDILNSISYNKKFKGSKSSYDVLKHLTKNYINNINNYNNNIDILYKKVKHFKNNVNNNMKELEIQIENEEKEKKFNETILNKIHDIKHDKNKKCDTLENKQDCIYEALDKLKLEYKDSKQEYINKFAENINKEEKILIFSDFEESFDNISNVLSKNNIKYAELDGGDYKKIDKIIKSYKESDVSILLINSSVEGCGMNLENTTHIIFLHKTSEILRNQIIGRAQRPGRTCKLNVITLLHNNEITDEKN